MEVNSIRSIKYDYIFFMFIRDWTCLIYLAVDTSVYLSTQRVFTEIKLKQVKYYKFVVFNIRIINQKPCGVQ